MRKFILVIAAAVFSLCSIAQTDSIFVDGMWRTYILYVPASYTAGTAVPLVLNLHGYTSNNGQQQFYSEFNPIADTANFIVCYPNGDSVQYNQGQWNSGWNIPFSAGIDDVGFLSDLIDSISANYSIDPNRVYSTGMSNGGYMSYRLACELDNKIAAIASVTGSMSPGQQTACTTGTRKVPIMQIHGTADPTVPYNGGFGWSLNIDSLISFWTNYNNCTGSPTTTNIPDINILDGCTATLTVYDQCANNTSVELYKIDGGGHTWPGAPITIGVTNQDFEASGVIWDFFYRHPMNSSTEISTEPNPTSFEVYPNPFYETITINAQHFEGQLQVFDLFGRKLHEESIAQSKNLDLSKLTKGIYFIKVGKLSKKLVKQ